MVPNFGHLNISFMGFLSYFYITYIVKLVFSLIFLLLLLTLLSLSLILSNIHEITVDVLISFFSNSH